MRGTLEIEVYKELNKSHEGGGDATVCLGKRKPEADTIHAHPVLRARAHNRHGAQSRGTAPVQQRRWQRVEQMSACRLSSATAAVPMIGEDGVTVYGSLYNTRLQNVRFVPR